MEIDLARLVLTPWLNPYPRMTCSPYLTSAVPGQFTNFGNVVSLHLDQRPSFLSGSRIRAGILKPKAIRVASLHPFVNPRLRQGSFGNNFEEVRGRTDNVAHSLGCSHSAINGVSAHLNAFYPTFPYLSPCPYGLNGHASLIDAESMLRDMLCSQKQIVYLHGTSSDAKRLEESRLAGEVNVLRMSQCHTSAGPGFFSQNSGHLQQELLSPKPLYHKCQPLPFKIQTKDSCPTSKCHESKGMQFCVQKRRHASLKTGRKRFMTPLNKTTTRETLTKRKTEQTTRAPKKEQENVFSQGVSSECSWLDSNVPLESPRSFPANREVPFQKHGLTYERTDIPSKSAPDENIEDADRKKIVDGRVLYSQLPGFSEERKSFRCSQCRYLTDRKNNLKRHVVTMHQESSKVLECCGVSFPNKAALRDHNSIFHRGGYRCQVCSRNFCRKALLRRHLTVHSGQKDFFCNICGYATSHKSNLERHQKVHTKREAGSDTGRKGVSIKVGVRFRADPSFSGVVLGSNRQTSPCGAVGVASVLSNDEAMRRYTERDENLQHNSHQTNNLIKCRETSSPLSRTIKEMCRNRLNNANTHNNRSLQCHDFLEINVTDKCHLGKADMDLQVAATEDSGVTALNLRSGENNSSATNLGCRRERWEGAPERGVSTNCVGVLSGEADHSLRER